MSMREQHELSVAISLKRIADMMELHNSSKAARSSENLCQLKRIEDTMFSIMKILEAEARNKNIHLEHIDTSDQ